MSQWSTIAYKSYTFRHHIVLIVSIASFYFSVVGLATRETRSNNNVHKMSVWEMAKEFWPDIKSLLTNGAYMCCTLSQAFTGFLIGACTFLPKLVQIGLK